MPSWIIHLVTANKICEKTDIKDKNQFIFANVMPDIFAGYQIKPSKLVTDYSTHYPISININGIDIDFPDLEDFREKYEVHFDNPVILGYFTHLITDYYWNKYTYERYFERFDKSKDLVKLKLKSGTKILTFDDAVKMKQNDFGRFADYLKNNIELNKINIDNNILENSKQLKEFEFTTTDIEDTVKYINELVEYNQEYIDKYEIFTKHELLNILEDSINFTLKYIE